MTATAAIAVSRSKTLRTVVLVSALLVVFTPVLVVGGAVLPPACSLNPCDCNQGVGMKSAPHATADPATPPPESTEPSPTPASHTSQATPTHTPSYQSSRPIRLTTGRSRSPTRTHSTSFPT